MRLIDIPWDGFSAFYDLIIHFDQHIHRWVAHIGWWIYVVSFGIICLETGVILFPFLPGDSLLFALGAVAAGSEGLSIPLLCVVLCSAAILGGLLNYATGVYLGPKIFHHQKSRWFAHANLVKTQAFYEKHGGKTIVIARFIPIFRTFVPLVAGIGRMDYKRFFTFNLIGGVLWVCLLIIAGAKFGNIPIVKKNFGAVIPMVIVVSLLPIILEVFKNKFRRPTKKRS